MPDPDIFQLFGPARYTPAGGPTFALAASMASDVFERRIIPRKRPYLDGAPLDDTGAEPDVFEVALLFARRGSIAGVTEPIYPDYHARFLRAFRAKGTATLYFPGRGEKRVKLKRASSQQTPAERDCEVVTLSLLEDLEDERATAASFTQPSAKGAAPVLARQLLEEAQSFGMGGDLLATIIAYVDLLTAAANAPFDSAAEILSRGDRLIAACDRAERALTRSPFGFSPLAAAEAHGPLALLGRLRDVAAVQRSALFGSASVKERRFPRDLSIFDIAAQLGQPADELVRLNTRLPSLFFIPAGVPVWTRAA